MARLRRAPAAKKPKLVSVAAGKRPTLFQHFFDPHTLSTGARGGLWRKLAAPQNKSSDKKATPIKTPRSSPLRLVRAVKKPRLLSKKAA